MTIFQRRPTPGCFSIEGFFANQIQYLREHCEIDPVVMPEASRGILPRVRNMLFSRSHQGALNHIAGDIHYIATLLDSSRTILTVLDCEMLHRTRGLRRWLLKFFWFTVPCRRVSAITVISDATKQELLRHIRFPENRIHVIPVFVDRRFRYCPKLFDPQCPKILQIGTRHNKNLERLIQALDGIRCQLWLVGSLTEQQKDLLIRHQIDYAQYQDLAFEQLRDLYERCDLVTFPSIHEGFGMPIVEAQVVGRPVLTSNCSSMPEVAGSGALLVDPHSVPDLADGVRRLISDVTLRETLVRAGRENCQRFSAEQITQQYMELYRQLGSRMPLFETSPVNRPVSDTKPTLPQ